MRENNHMTNRHLTITWLQTLTYIEISEPRLVLITGHDDPDQLARLMG